MSRLLLFLHRIQPSPSTSTKLANNGSSLDGVGSGILNQDTGDSPNSMETDATSSASTPLESSILVSPAPQDTAANNMDDSIETTADANGTEGMGSGFFPPIFKPHMICVS